MQINAFEHSRAHVSISEAAACAAVSRQAIDQWIAQGRLQRLVTDDGCRIDGEELTRFLAVRQAAFTVGIKFDTLLQWAHDADRQALS